MKKLKPKSQEGWRKNKVAVLTLAAVICALLVIGIVVFAASGDDEADRSRIAAQSAPEGEEMQPRPDDSAPTQQQQTDLTVEDVVVPPLTIYVRRNPFKPLIDMEMGQTETSGETTSTGGLAVVTVPPELAAGREVPDQILSRAVTLEGIYEQDGKKLARMRVADQLFDNLAVGDTFAGSYRLLMIGEDSSATVLYGDERFTVYVGQSIYW